MSTENHQNSGEDIGKGFVQVVYVPLRVHEPGGREGAVKAPLVNPAVCESIIAHISKRLGHSLGCGLALVCLTRNVEADNPTPVKALPLKAAASGLLASLVMPRMWHVD